MASYWRSVHCTQYMLLLLQPTLQLLLPLLLTVYMHCFQHPPPPTALRLSTASLRW
jgi:hypothetical protein